MKKAVVVFKNDEYDLEIEVSEATTLMGMVRLVVYTQEEAVPLPEGATAKDRIAKFVKTFTYPACMSATEKIKYNSEESAKIDLPTLTGDEFLKLPESLVNLWETIVFQLNPHWVPQQTAGGAQESGEAKKPEEPGKTA